MDSLGTIAHGVECYLEGASLTDLAGANQITVHAGRQTLGNGEPETGAIVCGVGATHLGELDERFHELLLVVLGNTDAGVTDCEAKCAGVHRIGVGNKGNPERDGSVLREFNSVAEQVDENLADADVVDVEIGRASCRERVSLCV